MARNAETSIKIKKVYQKLDQISIKIKAHVEIENVKNNHLSQTWTLTSLYNPMN